MIPILYEATETAFTSNGIGRLTDCIRCEVTEERNGVYELTMEYPMSGQHYADIVEGRIVMASHDDTRTPQPFIIYHRSAPLSGVVTFDAYHLSYRLSEVAIKPFTAVSCADAISKIAGNSIPANSFTFDTDKNVTSSFELTVPRSVRSLLGGARGSILDTYGKGEYEFDRWHVHLYLNRGRDRGVTIRYGKNLTDLTQEVDASGLYNAIVPYYQDENTTVTLPEWYVTESTGQLKTMVLDLSDEFDTVPTVQELRDAATAALEGGMTPDENIEVSFVALWETEDYKDFAALQRVLLCDTVTVEYPALGTSAKAQVIKVTYDTLAERYTEIELGKAKKSLAQVVQEATEAAIMEQAASKSYMQVAIEHATELIKGGYGGHVVIGTNAAGEPNEILIMDTDDKETARNVIRMNTNGIGFSTTGYQGPFTSAWTIDGRFNADFIATGHIIADFIQGGTLTLGNLDDEDGVLSLLDGSGNEVVRLDRNGITSELGTLGGWNIDGSTGGLSYVNTVGGQQYAVKFKRGDIDGNVFTIGKVGRAPKFQVMTDGSVHFDDAYLIVFEAEGDSNSWFQLRRSPNDGDDNELISVVKSNMSVASLTEEGNFKAQTIDAEAYKAQGYSGASGSFTAGGRTITVRNGIITSIS